MAADKMVAMVLAAGRGERMRPLTDRTPKALLAAGGKPLIFWQLEKLSAAGFTKVVVNHAHLGDMIESAVGDGRRWNIDIAFAAEAQPLETAGGIANALPLLGTETFAVVNADVYCEFDMHQLARRIDMLASDPLHRAHLILVDNPAHHPHGDFGLDGDRVVADAASKFTFSGLGVYRREIFANVVPGAKQALGPLLSTEMANSRVSGEYYGGLWLDVGTPQRLAFLDRLLSGAR
ncbi:MAG: N-acetylmuramate alpha-1-phosphate uridylyltransferase MurU [Burkholderiales bacterium]